MKREEAQVVIASPQEIESKREHFKTFDHLHDIVRDSMGNVINAHKSLGKKCHCTINRIGGKKVTIIPIDSTKCVVVGGDMIITGMYDICLYNFLCNIRVTGRTGKGYQEVLVYRDVVLALDGIIPNITELYLPLLNGEGKVYRVLKSLPCSQN